MGSRRLGLAGRGLRPHHQLDRGRPQRQVLRRHPPEHRLEQIDGGRGIALVEGDLGQHQRGERIARGSVQQLLRLGDAALPAAQIGEPQDRQSAPGGPLGDQFLGRGGQLTLGLAPAPLPGQDGAVVGPAGAGDEVDPHPAAELLDLAAPLGSALVVACPLASVEQQATGPPRRDDLLELSRQRRGGGLVEAAHAVRDPALVDEPHALDGQREHLEPDHAETAAQLSCPGGELLGPRLVALDHRHVPHERIEPTVLRAGLEPFKEAGRALEPAVGDRALATQDEIVVAEPDREHRRTPQLPLAAAEPVGALPGLHAGGHVLDPPRGPAQALQRLDRLVRLELRLEDRPRLVPAPRASAASPSRTRSPQDAISAMDEQ